MKAFATIAILACIAAAQEANQAVCDSIHMMKDQYGIECSPDGCWAWDSNNNDAMANAAALSVAAKENPGCFDNHHDDTMDDIG